MGVIFFMNKRIRLIATGGTIACMPTKEGLAPGLDAAALLQYVNADTTGVDCIDLFNMDSSNVQPEEWHKIAEEVVRTAEEYEGVVITHGTDTMAYTASMLSFMLRGIHIPVVLTGSQYPIAYPDSDGRKNLLNALLAAEELPGGVYIAFGNAIIKGCRAVKTRTTSLDAFESINYPYVGMVANGRCYRLVEQDVWEKPAISFALDPCVALIKLVPGTSPALLESLLDCDVHGVVVEAFGLGGMHNFRRDHTESIRRLIAAGIPVVLTSQCLYEASTPDIYQVSQALRDAGVISARDMTTEAAVTKLMWVMGQTEDPEEIRTLMRKNLCGEIAE